MWTVYRIKVTGEEVCWVLKVKSWQQVNQFGKGRVPTNKKVVMNLCYVIFIILVIFTNSFCDEIKSKELVEASGTKLSRHKRYVVFPEGSSVSVKYFLWKTNFSFVEIIIIFYRSLCAWQLVLLVIQMKVT